MIRFAHDSNSVLTFGDGKIFCFPKGHPIDSVSIPDGYDCSNIGYSSPCLNIHRGNDQDECGLNVCEFSMRHGDVAEARDRDSKTFRDLAVCRRLWRVRPKLSEGSDEGFLAMLVLDHAAIAVYGSDMRWTAADLTDFLARFTFRPG